MVTSGYSGRTVVQKLGVRAASSLALLDAPGDVEELLGPLPDDVRISQRLGGHRDLVLLFVTRSARLGQRIPAVTAAIAPDGAFWVAWPKRASGVATDVTEDVIRAVALPTGLVDVKVCAISEVWSGLKLVIRKELR